MWRLFRPREYRGQNKRHGFLKEYVEGEALIAPPLSLGIAPMNRCGIFNSGTPELQMPQHFFSSLCVSSVAGGKSFLETEMQS